MATSTTLSMNQFATTPMYELMDTEEAKKSFYGGRHAYTYHWIETMRNNTKLLEKRSGFSPGIVFKERPTKTILVTDTNGVERPRRNPNYVSDADWNDICEHVTAYFRRHISAEHHHLISDVEPGDVAGVQEALYAVWSSGQGQLSIHERAECRDHRKATETQRASRNVDTPSVDNVRTFTGTR